MNRDPASVLSGILMESVTRTALRLQDQDPSQNMSTFDELAASRRLWINETLRSWCRKASHRELVRAELEWPDIAGRVDPDKTLWPWAWERFPDLIHDDFRQINETYRVEITLKDGNVCCGFPEGRLSTRGSLMVVDGDDSGRLVSHGPILIDSILQINRTLEST
jgi:hypothetical protein